MKIRVLCMTFSVFILHLALCYNGVRGQGRSRNRHRGRYGNQGVSPQRTRSQTSRNTGTSWLDLLGISNDGGSFSFSIGGQTIQFNAESVEELIEDIAGDDNDEASPVTLAPSTQAATTPRATVSVASTIGPAKPWRGHGSFTGDIRLGCMEKKCLKGVVEIYNRENNVWGVICGDNWGINESKVVCNYLQFSKGARRGLRLRRAKVPKASRRLTGMFANVECDGNETTIMRCNGERLSTGECTTDRVAVVSCAGKRILSNEVVGCEGSEVPCGNRGMCVPPSYSCDGMADCPWGTDETNCGETCPSGSFACGGNSGTCVSEQNVCDGDRDCPDGSDESSCEDHLSHFVETPGVKLRLAERQYNSGWRHISPYRCAKRCREEKRFQCVAFDYNKAKRECDLTTESRDAVGLTRPPTVERANWIHFALKRVTNCRQFLCGDQCIPNSNVCDGTMQCLDGTDEQNCEPERADIPRRARLRLAAGPLNFEGRLEISSGDSDFGLICDVGWSIREAHVACRQLGFRRGALSSLSGQAFSRTNLDYKLSGVKCKGTETSLRDCKHDGWNLATCNMDHEAGVVCLGDRFIVPSTPTITRRPTTARTTTLATTTTPRPTRPPNTPSTPTCGNMPPHKEHMRSRVVGGTNASPNEWPWQAGIWVSRSLKCGGTLIDSCWILTAAHCFTPMYLLKYYTIRLGDHQPDVSDRTEQEFNIRRIINHPRYNTQTNDNDIALLELNPRNGRCAIINSYVKPACVPPPSQSFPANHKCYIIGWGNTFAGSRDPYTEVLKEATVPLIDRYTCITQGRYTSDSLTSNMFCAGYMKGGIDTCQGDSGGPLLCYDSGSGRYYVWGVVSWGFGCAEARAPGIYSKVNNYHQWIRDVTRLAL